MTLWNYCRLYFLAPDLESAFHLKDTPGDPQQWAAVLLFVLVEALLKLPPFCFVFCFVFYTEYRTGSRLRRLPFEALWQSIWDIY